MARTQKIIDAYSTYFTSKNISTVKISRISLEVIPLFANSIVRNLC